MNDDSNHVEGKALHPSGQSHHNPQEGMLSILYITSFTNQPRGILGSEDTKLDIG